MTKIISRTSTMKLFAVVFMALSLILGTLPVPTVSAQAPQCDEDFYSSNTITFYNPCEITTTCGGSGTGGDKIANLRGNNNGERIYNFWLDVGLSPQQAAGVTGSMQHEGGFSPFRQEMDKTWPDGGWGIAQFTFDPGQRGDAVAYVRKEVGEQMFTQYYKNQYGGAVLESNGFKPKDVPDDVNLAFLKAQLNYLVDHIKGLKPNDTRWSYYNRDFNVTINESISLYDYLKGTTEAADAAIAWTYLYEFPGDIKNTSLERAESAKSILEMYGNGVASSCGGGLQAGGMNLDEAIAFMKTYTDNPDNVKYIGGAGKDCAGGPLSNCVSFSVYFINKYTNLTGMDTGAPGHGSTVVANTISKNPSAQNGHSPRPYAIFSTPSGSEYCGNVKCGHTGVILGVDAERKKVIVGEAACGAEASWDTAREYDLSKFDNNEYTYIYTDGLLKEGVK